MLQAVLVACGGAIGSVLRFLCSGLAHTLAPGLLFPVGTLAVNVVGSLAIGLIGGLAETRTFLVPELRVFLFTGVLGGFTTFSAFAWETLGMAVDGAWLKATLNVSAQLVLGFSAAAAAYSVGRAL
jgi:fluoride exporter